MKNLLFALAALSLVFLTSCEKRVPVSGYKVARIVTEHKNYRLFAVPENNSSDTAEVVIEDLRVFRYKVGDEIELVKRESYNKLWEKGSLLFFEF